MWPFTNGITKTEFVIYITIACIMTLAGIAARIWRGK